MTLIETIIYTALLSLIVTSFLGLSYGIYAENMKLMNNIQSAYAGE